MKVHILDDWFDTLRGLPSFARLKGHDVTVWTDHTKDIALLAERLNDAEALVLFRERTAMTQGLIQALPGLKLISMRGAYPHVDVAACAAAGIMLSSNQKSDGGYSVAAAELSFALILAAARDLYNQMTAAKTGQWQLAPGQTLAGRTLGLYGYGRIAQAVARYAQAFGMRVIWWASDAGRARAQADGATVATSREAFFSESDFISLHQRLTPATLAGITAQDLALMKPSASLINTARAGLIAPGALLAALNAGRPGRAAIDVFDTEPLTDAADPLLAHPNLLATPHIGFVTEDELDVQFADIYDQINAFAAGAPIHVIKP